MPLMGGLCLETNSSLVLLEGLYVLQIACYVPYGQPLEDGVIEENENCYYGLWKTVFSREASGICQLREKWLATDLRRRDAMDWYMSMQVPVSFWECTCADRALGGGVVCQVLPQWHHAGFGVKGWAGHHLGCHSEYTILVSWDRVVDYW